MKIRTWRSKWMVFGLSCLVMAGCNRTNAPASANPTATANGTNTQAADADLTNRLTTLAKSLGDEVALSVIHVESGRAVAFEGAKKLQLYSVFKVPLAIAV